MTVVDQLQSGTLMPFKGGGVHAINLKTAAELGVSQGGIVTTPQEKMDLAFDNYIELSDILRNDLLALLENESDSQHWRRNYIRVSASLIEGLGHCLREMSAVSFECVSPEINKKEQEVILNESNFSANDRVKRTLNAAYKLFELQTAPNFGGAEWPRAQRVLQKRHALMHPKTPADLNIEDELWEELYKDVIWLIEQFFNFSAILQEKHG